MSRSRRIERAASRTDFDYRSWPALGPPSVTRPVTAEIVPRVLTFLHARFGGAVVGARPLTLQMLLSNDKSASERFPWELPSPRESIEASRGTAVTLCASNYA